LAKASLKERLIGTIVILCLALIFYPLFFNSKSEFEISRNSVIPTQTIEVEPLDIQDPIVPFEVEEVVLHELFNPDEDLDQVLPDELPNRILQASGLPNAWVVQVGSFAQIENAEILNEDLLGLNYKSYFRLTPSFDDGPDLYKVFVGPVLSTDEARALLTELSEHTGNEAILLKFEP